MYFLQCGLKKTQMLLQFISLNYYILPLVSSPLLLVIKFNMLHWSLLLLALARDKCFFPFMCELSADLPTDLYIINCFSTQGAVQ